MLQHRRAQFAYRHLHFVFRNSIHPLYFWGIFPSSPASGDETNTPLPSNPLSHKTSLTLPNNVLGICFLTKTSGRLKRVPAATRAAARASPASSDFAKSNQTRRVPRQALPCIPRRTVSCAVIPFNLLSKNTAARRAPSLPGLRWFVTNSRCDHTHTEQWHCAARIQLLTALILLKENWTITRWSCF